MLYGHGDNGYTYGQGIIADFSSNVWYGGEPAGLKEHLFHHWKRVNRYPEVLAESLTERVSRHHGLHGENILINNGSIESIYLIAQGFKYRRSAIVTPSFAEYEDACRMHGHETSFLDWGDLAALMDGSPGPEKLPADLLWIANPNNPTGAVFTGLEELIDHNPQTIFVVDEAFIDFTDSIQTAIPLLARFPNLVILRSLTKAFAIPGLRLGYIAAGKDIVEKLKALKLPWSVNTMALEAGNFIIEHYAKIRPPLAQLLQDKTAFVRQLQEVPVKTYASHTHFFLCETNYGRAAELQQYLLYNFGLSIRNADNFRGLGPKHFRLATLSPDRNQLLITALKGWRQ